MTKTTIRTHQISENAALQKLGVAAGTPLTEILAKIDVEVDFPLRLYAGIPADSKLYISASRATNSNGSQEYVGFADWAMDSLPASWIDFQAKGTSGGHFTSSFPSSSTVGWFNRCFVFKSRLTGLFAVFAAEQSDLSALSGVAWAVAAYPEDFLLGWVDLQATSSDGRYKTAGSSTSVIENAVSGTPRVAVYTGRGAKLGQSKVSPATSPTANDSAYSVGTQWVRLDTDQVWVLTDNTPTAAQWNELVRADAPAGQTLTGARTFASLLTASAGLATDLLKVSSAGLMLKNTADATLVSVAESGELTLGPMGFSGVHSIIGSVAVSSNLTVTGSLTVNGEAFKAFTQEVIVGNNLMVLNSNETGAGVSAGSSGIEIERGTEINYRFVFDEGQDNFRVGVVGSLQAVATREDSPTSSALAYWNSSLSRFDTNASLTYDANATRLKSNFVQVDAAGAVEFGDATNAFMLSGTHLLLKMNSETLIDIYNGNEITLGAASSGKVEVRNGLFNIKGQTGQQPAQRFIAAENTSYFEWRNATYPSNKFVLNSNDMSLDYEHISVTDHAILALGRVGNYVHTIRGTGALGLPTGDMTKRNVLTATQGNLRFNTTTSVLEYFTGSAWSNVASEEYAKAAGIKYSIVFG